MRIASAVAGLAVLSAITHVNIASGPGYGSAQSTLMLAVAAGVAASALATGAMWQAKRRWLALGLVLAMAAGEVFTLIGTAERLIAAREAAQAPLKARAAERESAAERVAKAEAALAKAEATVASEASQPGCRTNCARLLQAAVNSAGVEVKAARAALAGIETPAESAPLAARLGVAPWVLDLVHAGVGSAASNILAFLLLACAAHGHAPPAKRPPRQRRPVAAKPALEAAEVQPPTKPVSKPAKPRGKPRVKAARLGSSPLDRLRAPSGHLH
jgi:hypothetical protein